MTRGFRSVGSLISLAAIMLVCGACMFAQTTQGVISGQVYDRKTGRAIAGATVKCRLLATQETREAQTNEQGFYTLALLSPGVYWLRAEKPNEYQARETYDLELFVAGRVDLNFPLRQLADTYSQDLYASGYLPESDAIVHVYAADLETTRAEPLHISLGRSGTLLSTLSYTIDPQQVRNLPLSGRDIYTMLVALPGVTADNATARGLGLSINGQRSSSSNFLLDGVDNNDYLLTGPATVLPPEAVQEYRVSTNNFSAEFGRTAGFLANAITRAGANAYHGTGYYYFNDSRLNANSFQHKAGLNTSTNQRGGAAVGRQPQTDWHAGFWTGGPVLKDRAFWSAALERFRSRSLADVFPYQVPVAQRVAACFPQTYALTGLAGFELPVPADPAAPFSCDNLSATYERRPRLYRDRTLALARLDTVYRNHRIMGRVALGIFDEPYFIFNLYPGLSSALNVTTSSLALSDTWTKGSLFTNEWRFGWRDGHQGWDRPHSERPELATARDGSNFFRFGIQLPASEAAYAFRYDARSWELSDSITAATGRHLITAGGGLLLNRSSSLLTFRRDGRYEFPTLQGFAGATPSRLQITVSRQDFPGFLRQPRYGRTHANNQFYGFVQDNIRLGRALTLNLGARYESFGAQRNTGEQDAYFQPGAGATIEDRLAGARLVYDGSHQRSLYRPDRNNWASRVGLAYNTFGGRTVFRVGYGIFYDRLFDNLTESSRNNNIVEVTLRNPSGYPKPLLNVPSGAGISPDGIPTLLWLDEGLRTPYVQSWFGGVQQQLSPALYLEINAQGALGRKLIGTDRVNRRAPNASANEGRANQLYPENILFRSNFAAANYTALTTLARYRTGRAQFQLAYTWSHSIDNQSDPLQGTFDDLQVSRSSNVNLGDNVASLTRQFDSRGDRASSDFDQRQNLIFLSIWDVPGPRAAGWKKRVLSDWRIAQIAGFRSGFPYNLIATSDLPPCPTTGPASLNEIVRNRPGLLPGRNPELSARAPIPGGYQVLDPTAFCNPGPRTVGALGRNALTGPGFWNVDFSAARSFHFPWLGEAGAIQFRADFFNVFNHANLGNPNGLAEPPPNGMFGQAFLGRQGVQPAFPSAAPLDQLPRQIQLQLKVIF